MAIVFAILVGFAVMAIPTMTQPHFIAGSVPDLVCELFLLPGKLIASAFHDRGTASPEFLLRTRLATIVLFGGVAYWVLRLKKS